MSIKSIKAVLLVALTVPVMLVMVPGASQLASADITCENSDYNCIYVDITDGRDGNRIVCTRAVCGGGSFGGRQYRLEGLYAFDGVNPNSPTTTLASQPLAISVNGGVVSATGTGTCSYSGGTYLDPDFSSPWNTTSSASVSCNWSGSFVSSNLQPGTTYYVRVTFSDNSGSVTGTSSFVAPAAETTTTLRPVTTTTIAGATINPCLDPSNPNYACGWAILGPNNQVGGVIVCTFAVCGSGSFGGMRLALQGQQTPDGNVAGWSGGTYDEESQTFSLPGGGTLRSGDRLEDAVFPTTTTVADNTGSPAEPITEILAESGVVYEDSNSYVNGESEVAVTNSQIAIELPPLTVTDAEYVATFDPDGPSPERIVQSGQIEDGETVVAQQKSSSDVSAADGEKIQVSSQSLVVLPLAKAVASNNLRILINRKVFGEQAGVIKIKISTASGTYATLSSKVLAPKKYSSCRALRRDYPGGVRSPGLVTDKRGSIQAPTRVKPVVNLAVFKLNKSLDVDRDRIACEAIN